MAGLCFGVLLLVFMNLLEGKWLIAVLSGIALLCALLLSGRIERFLFGFLFFAFPFNADFKFKFYWLPEGAESLTISVISLSLALLYPFFILRILQRGSAARAAWPVGFAVLIGVIGWASLSMLNAQDYRLSLILLVHWAISVLLYFYLSNRVENRDDLWWVARWFMAGLLLECLICWGQYLTQSSLGLEMFSEREELHGVLIGSERFFRLVGTFNHPNVLGTYLVAALPVVLALNFAPTRFWMRLFIFALSGLGVSTLIFTLNRSAWLAAGLSWIGLFIWIVKRRYIRFRLIQLLVVFVILGVIFGFFGPLIAARWMEDDRGSAASRIPQIQMALAMVERHPVLGVGLGNYGSVKHLYETYFYNPSDMGRVYSDEFLVHNAYLLMASEIGVVGLVWFAWLVWTIVRAARIQISHLSDARSRLILAGFLSGFFALLINNAAQPRYFGAHVLFWCCSGVLVSGIRDS